MKREKFGSRLGFILISAGCAIGLGNVWRFPTMVGENGGAAFVLIYLAFLVIFGLPIMTMEFAVGRASQKSISESFKALEKKGTKWHLFGYVGMMGNYLLMMFYTMVTGWMISYLIKMARGDFSGLNPEAVAGKFDSMVSNPIELTVFMVIAVAVGFLICSLGLKKGVEKITKVMMLALLGIIIFLAVISVMQPGAGEGVKYYLIPDFAKMKEQGISKVIFAALGQAFFTLSIGMGSMAIFGSYIDKDRKLFGESLSIAILDTFVALMSGLIIIPACFAFGVGLDSGPSLIFTTLPNIFNKMGDWGQVFGTFFFVFMIFAAMSTLIAVFENINSCCEDIWGWSRKKCCLINFFAIIILSMPCILGFNVLAGFTPFGPDSNIMDLEDFIISNNILPLGSIIYVVFCTNKKYGWGWDNFMEEANTGKGISYPKALKIYSKYVLPIILLVFWVQGIITKFI